MSDQSTGSLSQVIANALTAAKQIAAFDNLPDTAKTIQSQAITILNDTIPKIKTVQVEIQKFVNYANPLLTKAESEISENTSLDSIKLLVTQVNSEASSLKSSVTETDSNVESAFSDIANLSKQLNSVESTLNSDIISLKVQLQSAHRKVAALKKKEKYYSLLGIFGAAGLAAAIALIVKTNKRINSLEKKMYSLNSQASQISMMKEAVQSMETDFMGLSNKLSSLKNAVDFLSSDITEVINDLDKSGGNLTVAKLYIQTSVQEVHTLAIDAS